MMRQRAAPSGAEAGEKCKAGIRANTSSSIDYRAGAQPFFFRFFGLAADVRRGGGHQTKKNDKKMAGCPAFRAATGIRPKARQSCTFPLPQPR